MTNGGGTHARTLLATASFAAGACGVAACSLVVDRSAYDGAYGPTSLDASDAPSDGLFDGTTNDGGLSCNDATLCDDFDHGPFDASWTKIDTVSGVEVVLTESERSPPYAALVRVPAAAIGIERPGLLVRDLGRGTKLACSFDVDFERDTIGPFGQVDLLTVQTAADGITSYELRLGIQNGATSVREDIRYPDGGGELPRQSTFKLFELLPRGWVHVEVTTDFATTSVSFDTRRVLLNQPQSGIVPLANIQLSLGLYAIDEQERRARYDNVVCALLP